MQRLLSELIQKGIRFSAVRDQLKIQLGSASLSKEESNSLKENKEAIISYLQGDKISCLSYAQERLWFLAELGHSVQYNVPGVVRINGDLDHEALQKAMNFIAARHESLRTGFRKLDGIAVQSIRSTVDFRVDNRDLSRLNQAEREKERQRIIGDITKRPFNLEQAPLMRVALIKFDPDTYILAICMHHIICDGWSMGILIREIRHAYQAYIQGKEPYLEDLKVQYADYAVWQREFLTEAKLDKELTDWSNYLAGYQDLDMPTDHPRPKEMSGKGGHLNFRLDSQKARDLKKFCQERDITVFTALLASIYILLRRYSHQQDICIGMAVANRNRLEMEDLVGFFVNTLVLRINPASEGAVTVEKLLQNVHEGQVAAQDRQNVPFEKIVESIKPARELSRSPIFQVTANYKNRTAEDLKFGDSTLVREELEHGTSKFDLIFEFSDKKDGSLGINLEYSRDLYLEETVARMGDHLVRIMNSLPGAEEQPIDDLELLAKEDRKKLLTEWNTSAIEYSKEISIPDLFAQQVQERPNDLAVVFEGKRLTYKDLDERSTKLALYLQDQGLKPKSLVGLCIQRSFEMLVGIMGILKTRCAYVPIEPEYPDVRIQHILEDSDVKILLTQEALEGKLSKLLANDDSEIISLDKQWPEIAGREGKLTQQVRGGDLAYVIYTSGSTGKPKGTLIEHKNTLGICKYTNYIEILPTDAVLQWSSFAFDGSIFEIFGTLLNGATLVLVKKEDAIQPKRLSQVIEDNKVTVSFITTALFNSLVDHSLSSLQGLRKILFGGEKVSISHVNKALGYLGQDKLIHMYGPTETTVYATFYPITKKHYSHDVPIGRAITNLQLYVLDETLRLQPIGVPGELHISGAGLSRGYLKQDELTKAKFIDNPFNPGTRMYKTGDLVKWLPDGNIEFVGRIDHQVKIRGFRVECGEIETVLSEYPAVQKAVVIARRMNNSLQLIAYYLKSDSETAPEVGEIRRYLEGRLPDYMIPTAFVLLEAIPITANGKVDRKALLKQEIDLVSSEEYVAPETVVEKQIAGIWEQVLGVERVGLHDNFFELGGHSLLAMQIISRIQQEFSIELAVRRLFEAPSVAGLARAVGESTQARVVSISSIERPEQLPLSYAQERLWFLAELGLSEQYHIPGAAEIRGELDEAAFQKTLDFIVARHESLRTGFRAREGQAFQVVSDTAEIPLEKRDLSDLELNEQAKTSSAFIREFSQRPFDLEHAPLMRAALIRLSSEKHILALCMHHIISDGWSIGIMQREIRHAYEAYRHGEKPTLADLKLQYPDYALWQRQVLTEERLQKELAEWRNYLSGYEDLNLPTDFARPKELSGRGGHFRLQIAAEEAAGLRQFCQEQQVTLFTVFLTGVYILLRRYSGQEDICIGMPVANRNNRDIEDLVGFFVNTIVIRIAPESEDELKVAALLRKIYRNLLAAQERQNIPFEKVVEHLQPARDLTRSPIFQVSINYVSMEGLTGEATALGGSTVQGMDVDYSGSKFDLEFDFSDTADGGIGINIEFSPDLYRAETIQRMAGHLVRLITGLSSTREQAVDELELLGASEREQLFEWNETDVADPADKCLHDLFADQAGKTPHRVAIVFEDQMLTYGELQDRSTKLAVYLQGKGVGPDSLVGICLEQSLDMIMGILAILKAGGAYVPVDPGYPESRMQYMLTDSGVSLVLTHSYLVEKLSSLAESDEREVLAFDQELEDFDPGQTELSSAVRPHHLAYVIYTSGSTGKPKGVLVEHRSVVNHNMGVIDLYEISGEDRMLQFSTFCFDFFVEELFPVLFTGAAIVLFSDAQFTDFNRLKRTIRRYRISILDLPTAFWHSLSDEAIDEDSLRLVIVGGEAMDNRRCHAWRRLNKNVSLVNSYGPTEATVAALFFKIDDEMDSWQHIPIGTPLRNTQSYVLNEQESLLPVGLPGQLHIAGACLARGYLNRPDLTLEKFIPNPFQPGTRMYKTGDLTRWLPDGNVEFVGRIDHQVKVRGFRIECGEIETVMAAYPDIHEAVVIARKVNNNTQLIAYYVADEAEALEASALRSFLQRQLPNYMVPTGFVKVESLPLTANGKIDRRALLRLDVELESGREYVAPRTATELQLSEIWQELLGVDRVGVNANFFEMGGHSLLAVRLISRIKQELEIELPLSTLFQHSTIADIAAHTTAESGALQSKAHPVAIQPRGEKLPLYLVHGVGGNSLSFIPLSQALGSAQPLFAFESPGLYANEESLDSTEALASFYIDQLLANQNGPYLLGGWSMGGVVALEMALQLQRKGQKAEHLILLDSYLAAHADAFAVHTSENGQYTHGSPTPEEAFRRHLYEAYGNEISVDFDDIEQHQDAHEDRLATLIRWVKSRGLLQDIDRNMVLRLMQVQEANRKALDEYYPDDRYGGNVSYIYAKREKSLIGEISGGQTGEEQDHRFQKTLSIWQDILDLNGDNVYQISGNHFSILQQPLVTQTASCIESILSKSTARNPEREETLRPRVSG